MIAYVYLGLYLARTETFNVFFKHIDFTRRHARHGVNFCVSGKNQTQKANNHVFTKSDFKLIKKGSITSVVISGEIRLKNGK